MENLIEQFEMSPGIGRKTVQRLAYGIAVGADLEYSDEIMPSRALLGHNEM